MSEQMEARGPDDDGLTVAPLGGGVLALGSRRLAIIDPSPAGHQPMRDPLRRTEIVFNGMIYNFRALRDELVRDGERFSSGCDTEVVLRAYGRWGEECVERLDGMFAFAVRDERTNRLFIARDRLGIKPLYYCSRDGEFLVASQVKALLASGLVPLELDPAGIRTYLAAGAVAEPLTAVSGVRALPAGHVATVDFERAPAIRRYWRAPEAARAELGPNEAAGRLRGLLEEAVGRHLVSDAPLGVFLSGGIDSSVLAALASRSIRELRTVSVALPGSDLSEEPYIRLVASHIGSQHVQVDLRGADFAVELDGAFAAMDQPTFDGVNTFFVAQAASQAGLKVALSGLGADELFDGYGLVRRVATLERARSMPPVLQRATARVLARAAKQSSALKTRDWLDGSWPPGSSYELLRSLFSPVEVARLTPVAPEEELPAPASVDARGDLSNQVSALDLSNYMKNVLLRDTDAMSMSQSLEVRVPYLDDRLVEWALRLPAAAKGRGRKAVLRAATADLLPGEVLSRPKQGFALPLGTWLSSELAAEAADLLAKPPEAIAELVEPRAVQAVWDRFDEGDPRWHRPWALYSLCRWFESARAATTAPVVAAVR